MIPGFRLFFNRAIVPNDFKQGGKENWPGATSTGPGRFSVTSTEPFEEGREEGTLCLNNIRDWAEGI